MAGGQQDEDDKPRNALTEEYWKQHPGLAESLIPVWGSAREAVADYHDGDLAGAVMNGALAASDFWLASALAKGLAKGGAKGGLFLTRDEVRRNYKWGNVRRKLGEAGFVERGQPVHHWLFERNRGLGKYLPDGFKNQPWNFQRMPPGKTYGAGEIHGRISGSYNELPRFNALQRYYYGVPTPAKVVQGTVAGHAATGAKARLEKEE